jgi:hypothetical protein
MSAFEGLSELEAIMRILPSLHQIERGAGFCEDRGYGWSVAMEEREGRALIAEAFAKFPRLGELMPDRAEALRNGTVLACTATSLDIERALAVLSAT